MKTQQQRHEEAIVRQSAYDKRTPEQQLQILDERLGKGLGAKKERAKLNSIIAQRAAKKNKKKQKA